MHHLIFAATVAALATLLAASFGADDLTQLREWWHDRRPPDPWTREELREMRADLVAARSRRDRRRNPYREHRRRQHLRAAGFRIAGGPMGVLP